MAKAFLNDPFTAAHASADANREPFDILDEWAALNQRATELRPLVRKARLQMRKRRLQADLELVTADLEAYN